VGTQSAPQNIRRHRRLKSALTGEKYNRMDERMFNFEKISEAPRMTIILQQWILE
jgi:hypothetical protein